MSKLSKTISFSVKDEDVAVLLEMASSSHQGCRSQLLSEAIKVVFDDDIKKAILEKYPDFFSNIILPVALGKMEKYSRKINRKAKEESGVKTKENDSEDYFPD